MYSSVDAAKHPCVPSQEQNGLVARECLVTERVVRTGLEFFVPKMKLESLHGKIVYIIGNPTFTLKCVIDLPRHHTTIADSLLERLEKIKKDIDEFKGDMVLWCFLTSILDLPTEYRSKGIVICFDESSYSGRQSLFHQFGSGIVALSQEKSAKIGSKPYQAFVELMEKVQESGDAIVFVPKALQNETLKEVMWCPAKLEKSKSTATTPCPPISALELAKVSWNPDVIVQVGRGVMYPVDKLPSTLKDWISSEFPGTNYVNFGPAAGLPKGIRFNIWGWNELPKTDAENNPSRWWSTFDTVDETRMTFNEYLDIAIEDARAGKNIFTKEVAYCHNHPQKAENDPCIVMFDAPLVDQTQHGYKRTSKNTMDTKLLYSDCDILIGFVADTDATFDLVLDNEGDWSSPVLKVFPFEMKAGEFCLAWRNKGVIPGIRIAYNTMWIQNLKGSVRRIGAYVRNQKIRPILGGNEFQLDSDGWFCKNGRVLKGTSSVL